MSTTTQNDLHPIFSECCRDISSRFHTDAPFVAGQWVYATDHRIIVRADAAGREPTDDERLPPVDRLAWPSETPAVATVALPDVGSGTVPCEDCEGAGKFGDCECWECDGKGTQHDFDGVDLGPVTLAKCYIAILRRHGVEAVYPIGVLTASDDPKEWPAAYFKGDGFEGIVMGKEPESRC